jgi:ABC-type polysaccharide/polyol phosphate export permease
MERSVVGIEHIPVNARPAQFKRYLDLVQIFASRALKVRYRGSILGIYWSLSNPIIMTAIYATIFGTAFVSYYGNSVFNYVLACFVGLAVLNFFSTSTSQALQSLVEGGALLNKIRLPFSVFPVSTILANAFQFMVGVLPLLAVIAFVRSHNPINVLAILVPTAALFLVCMGFALMMSALFVFFRDLPYLYEMTIFLIWITSPVFYPAQLVPAAVRPFIALNPIAMIMESFRQIALSGERPALRLMAVAMLTGLIFFAAGVAVFNYLKDDFMDLI